ncbi:MAG: hypothetical protein QOC60_1558 [Frankiaceae bacterium]|nr:hypothetical protein [Frankiaceae bacterium]
MSAVAVEAPGGAGAGYRHEAYFYRGSDGFLAATLPFVQESLAVGEPILVAVAEPRLALLRDALGGDASQVALVDMSHMGRNPARIIPAWLQFLNDAGAPGRPVRGIGEPIWAGRSEAELAECQIHEALLNRAVDAQTDFWLRCPYDTDALDVSVIEEAQRSHPLLSEDFKGVNSDLFAGQDESVSSLFGLALPQPPLDAVALVFDADRLWQIRQEVRAWLVLVDAAEDQISDVVLAVHELATNSVRHGGGVGRFRAWRRGGTVTFEIADNGRVADPMVGRLPPSIEQTGGRGVWLANQLCDLVQIRSGDHGTTVRVTLAVG